MRKEKETARRGARNDERFTASYKVNYSDTLLAFLLRKCKTSRNNVKSLLARRQVLVNGSVVTQFDYPLAKDDEVKLAKNASAATSSRSVAMSPRSAVGSPRSVIASEAKQSQKRAASRQPIKILLENEDFIAIDKPAGLLSVESDKDGECAYAYVAAYLKARGKNARPYVLHRIDKETSGVLVFAKNPKIHSMLRMRWNECVTLREYIAVAEGVFEEKEGTIVSYLKQNANDLMYCTQDPSGQKAVTHYRVEKENGVLSLLRVSIDTGRKNQIRVQLRSIGHGVVGDDKYGSGKGPLGRLGLHASRLEFIHPVTKELVSIGVGAPANFWNLF